jgi:uncharacterized protein YqeY
MSGQSEREPLRLRLRVALTRALKTHDSTAVTALRSALGAIDNAESIDPSHAPKAESGPIAGAVSGLGAGEVVRRALSEREMEDIVRAEVTSRQSAAVEYERLDRSEDAARLRAEAAILGDHLDAR